MQTIAFLVYAAFFRKSTQNLPSLSAGRQARGKSVTIPAAKIVSARLTSSGGKRVVFPIYFHKLRKYAAPTAPGFEHGFAKATPSQSVGRGGFGHAPDPMAGDGVTFPGPAGVVG